MGNNHSEISYKFIDEAGDLTSLNVGTEGVSKAFLLGMIEIEQSLKITRRQITKLEECVENDPYYQGVPSVQKRIRKYGKFFFHAKDDRQEIRKLFFDYLRNRLEFSYEAVFIPKTQYIMNVKYDGRGKERKIYVDLLSKLLRDKKYNGKTILIISKINNNFLDKTMNIVLENIEVENFGNIVEFVSVSSSSDPILSVVDYCNWAVQRVLEREDKQYLNFLWDTKKIKLINDVYEITNKYPKSCYSNDNRLLRAVEIKRDKLELSSKSISAHRHGAGIR
jgi:hypothetical protein